MGGRVGLFSTLVARIATCSGFMKDKGVRSAQTLSSDDLARIPARVAWWGPVSYQHLPVHDFPCAWFFGILGPVSNSIVLSTIFLVCAWFCGVFGPVSCQHLPIHDFRKGNFPTLDFAASWGLFHTNIFSLCSILRHLGPVSCQHLPIHDFPCAWFCGILEPVSCQHFPCNGHLGTPLYFYLGISLYFILGSGLYFCSA